MDTQRTHRTVGGTKRIGIMGGTFNPIHIGHLMVAERAYEQFELDKVLIMPTNNPPHKPDASIASDFNRCAMVELAIDDNPHFEISLIEINRQGITYTSDTLKELTEKHPHTEWYFILGGDSLASIEKWREPEVIFRLATVLVAVRDEYNADKMMKQKEHLEKKFSAKIELLNAPNVQISSTEIRERLKSNLSCKYMLPTLVEGYIENHKLYKNAKEEA